MLSQSFRGSKASVASLASSSTQKQKGKLGTEVARAAPRKRREVVDEATLAPTANGKAKRAKKEEKEGVKKAEEEEEKRPLLSRAEIKEATTIAYPALSFDLDHARRHLTNTDVRFGPLLAQIPLRTYEEVAQGTIRELDLFRTLSSSILGQQVSWLAARAIIYRFCRLFCPDALPEKPDFEKTPRDSLPFPHPLDVCEASGEALRSAGLSWAKVKYVKDVAARFSDGRLDARKIMTLDEEECIKQLVEIKGVGRWTAEMLLMFALRRPDVLPVGDLGVQRGMVLFHLAGRDGPSINKRKKKTKEGGEEEEGKVEDGQEEVQKTAAVHGHAAPIPSSVNVGETTMTESQVQVEAQFSQQSQHAMGPHVSPEPDEESKIFDVAHQPQNDGMQPLPIDQGITPALLKSRKEGKKAKGNVYLT